MPHPRRAGSAQATATRVSALMWKGALALKLFGEHQPLKGDGDEFVCYFGRSDAMSARQQVAGLGPECGDPLGERRQ